MKRRALFTPLEVRTEGAAVAFGALLLTGFICIVILNFSFVARAEEIPLALDEAIAISLRDNRDILLEAEELKKAKEQIAEAKAGLLPTLDFTASRTYTRGLYPKDLGQTTTQATLKQYLYKGGKTINTLEKNKYKAKVKESLLEKKRLETLLNVKKAFYTLLLAKEFTSLNKIIMENTKAHLEAIQARYLAGQASESEILKVRESLSAVIEAYETSLSQVESSAVFLKSLLYLDDKINIKPASKFTYEPKAVAYAEGFLQAIKNRPEIRQYEAQERADKKEIEIAKADNRPSVYASWDYFSRSTTSLTFSPTKGWQDYNVIGVTFSWPIFDGWATKAKVEQAIIDLKKTALLKEKTIQDIAVELKNAYLDLKNAVIKMKSAQAQLELYEDALSVIQDKYKAGIASELDLSDVSAGYEVSLFNEKESIYDYLIAQASFDKATGGL